MSTPATTIYLCSGVKLNSRYDHTIYFATPTAQNAYFNSKVARTYTAYSYVRKTWTLKVAATMEAARVWSYLFFRNDAGKAYYYFINQCEYVNDNTVELFLELDVMQTYMFNWTLNQCYIEREHSATDAVGDNTVDEGLEVGELITNATDAVDLSTNMGIMMAATLDVNKFYISQVEDDILGAKYDGIFGAFGLTITDLDNWGDLVVMLNYLNTEGKADAVYMLWQYPQQLVTSNNGTYNDLFAKYVTGAQSITHPVTMNFTLDGYTPRNNKLLQYPFNFLYASNNNGGAAVYKYEYWLSTSRTFRVEGNIAPDAVVQLVPISYKMNGSNYDEALSMGNFPVCAWNNDVYKLWLAQNQNTQNMSFAMSGLKILGGAAAMVGSLAMTAGTAGAAAVPGVAGVSAGAGLAVSGVTDIASQLAQRADKEVQPSQVRGTYSGNHNTSRGLMKFTFYKKSVDAYHAQIIDDFFDLYGYATRQVKVPNISSRPSWNYVKTVGSNVSGNFCMEDLRAINNIFDRGITFWKSGDSIGNYNLSNTP